MAMSPRLLRPLASSRFGDLRVGLTAYWPLNEDAPSGDVTAVDFTGRGNNLTSNNSVLSAAGKVGNAREFVAANSEFLSGPDSADTRLGDADWTLSCWMYVPTAANGEQRVIAKDVSGARNWDLFVVRNTSTTANRFGIGMFRNGNVFVGAAIGPDRNNADFIDRWWHLTVTNLSGVVTLHENGAVVSGAGSAATVTRPAGTTWNEVAGALNIGRREFSGFQQHFTGLVDEVAMWSRALSLSDISRLYNNGNGIDLRK
jgi:hypothetical protein